MLDVTTDGSLKRRRQAVYGATKKEAERKLGQARDALAASGGLPTADVTVEAWLTRWLEKIAPKRVQPTTLVGYRSKVRLYIVPAIGARKLSALRPQHVRDMYDGMEEAGLAKNTRQQTHAILSRALKVAVREEMVRRNVCDLIDPPGAEIKEPVSLPADEITKVLLHIRGMRLESRWLVALALGLRQGECLGLTWDRVDLEAGTLRVEQSLARINGELTLKAPKSRKSRRTIPLPTDVLDSLTARWDDYLAEREAGDFDDGGLVWGRPDGLPYDNKKDWQGWVDVVTGAGVTKVRLHDARHSAATTLVLLGVPLPVISAILGHADITTTMRYVHPDLTAMQAAVDLLNASRRKALEG